MIIKARLELAELAITKQRERQAQEKAALTTATKPSADSSASLSTVQESASTLEGADDGADGDITKLEEKALAKAKRKAEKEAQAAMEKREEEERQRRREEKLRDIEEAKLLKEQKQKEFDEFLKLKAEKDARIKAEEEAETARQLEELQKRREEKEKRKLARLQARLDAEERVRQEVEQMVLNDPWTQDQQIRFEEALLKHTVHSKLDKRERWTLIARHVEGKSKNQCIRRYKYLKDFVAAQRKLLTAYEHANAAASNMF